MKYKITTHCCWFRGGSMIVKMYFINGMPFTFDELPEGHLRDQDLIKEADKHRTFNDVEISVVGSTLTFTVAGIGSTSLTLS